MLRKIRHFFSGTGSGPTLIRALAGSAGLRIVGMALGFLVGVQLARGLGASGLGVYGLAMSIISVVSIAAEFGMPQLVTREVASAQVRKDWGSIQALLRWTCQTAGAVAVVGLFIGALVVWWWFDATQVPLAYALSAGFLLVLLTPLSNIFSAAIRGMQQIVKGQLPEIVVRPALYSALLLGATLFAPGALTPHLAMALQVLAMVGSAWIAYFFLRQLLPQTAVETATKLQASQWLHSSWPMALTEAMRVLHGNVSVLVLGAMVVPAMVGIFRVSSSMGALLTMPISLVHIVLAPDIARLHAAAETAKLQRLLGFSSLVMVFGVSLLTLPFLIFGEQLLGLMFGNEFEGANTSLLILSFGSLLGSMFGPGATLLNMTGHEKRVVRSYGLSLIILCILTPVLIKFVGIEGAALANSIAFVLWSALMWWDSKKLLGVDSSIAGPVWALLSPKNIKPNVGDTNK